MTFKKFKDHAENGLGALVSRGLIVMGTVIAFPTIVYFLSNTLDRIDRTYSETRGISRDIQSIDRRLDRQDERILYLEHRQMELQHQYYESEDEEEE